MQPSIDHVLNTAAAEHDIGENAPAEVLLQPVFYLKSDDWHR
jgi:hypothetical protein